MKITAIRAHAVLLKVELDITSPAKTPSHQACVVEIETDAGITGHGITSIGPAVPIKAAVDAVAAPQIIGMDPLNNDRIWDKLYWALIPRGQTGIGMHAIAAIDVALWDIKGKAANMPVFRLLGGEKSKVPVYATGGYLKKGASITACASELGNFIDQGYRAVKLKVGHHTMEEEIKRVSATRDAIGDAMLMLDMNACYDLNECIRLGLSGGTGVFSLIGSQ